MGIEILTLYYEHLFHRPWSGKHLSAIVLPPCWIRRQRVGPAMTPVALPGRQTGARWMDLRQRGYLRR